MTSFHRLIFRDAIAMLFLTLLSLVLGVSINYIRKIPVFVNYESASSRLERSIFPTQPHEISFGGEKDVELHEMREISSNQSTPILDARPRVFYERSHIPSSLSLPRDEFISHYQTLQNTLALYRDKEIVVYCSSIGCQDSQMVANALQRLGYTHVRIFRGGWDEWSGANLPEEDGK